MIKSLTSLAVVSVEFEDLSSSIFFVDLLGDKVFNLSGNEMQDEIRDEVISIIREQQVGPEIPYEQINEVIQTERKLQAESGKHIFRRHDL